MTESILILSTCPDMATGENIAQALVKESLAACVNILPGIQSVYRWQGGIENDSECLLIIKTKESLYRDIESRVKQLHPYELPEVIAVSIVQGLESYLGWISENTRQENENNS